MTNPVVLYGTQSNGETLPVQVDEFGRLVAEGLPGSEGPPGPPGGAFPLPADPYEGALLGWLNGGLAWVSEPAVILPEGVFGPIISHEDGLIVVEGSIPPEVQTGVYLNQVDKDGIPYNPPWNQSFNWPDFCSTSGSVTQSFSRGFDTDISTSNAATYGITLSLPEEITFSDSLKMYVGDYPAMISVNGVDQWGTNGTAGWNVVPVPGKKFTSLGIRHNTIQTYASGWAAIEVDGRILASQDVLQQVRVNQIISDNTLIGVAGPTDHMTVGAYLKIPAQKVAPWVYFAGRPEARIDHMQRLSGLVPPTDIDLLR